VKKKPDKQVTTREILQNQKVEPWLHHQETNVQY
jgi:hypothetical protein